MKNIFKKLVIFLLLIIVICITVLWIYKNIFFPRKYKDIVEQACSIYNADPNLIYAIIKQESKFNKDAISSSGAKGLMQIMDTTAQDMVKSIDSISDENYDIYDPYTNIFIGTKYISYLINHFDGNYYLAITAYNAGMGNMEKWLNKPYTEYTNYSEVYEIIEYKETRNYITNVISYYDFYTKLYN